MNDAIILELRFFGTSILWGILLLVMYDFLRIIRRIIRHNGIIVAVQDIIYWIICSILIFRMMYKLNNGIIRGFSILAMLLGMIIYHYGISDGFVDLASSIINKILKIIGKLMQVIFTPFVFIIKGILRILTWVYTKLKKLFHYFIKLLKKFWKSSNITVSDEEKGD